METVVAVPLEEYLTTSYEPECEWVDGELRERNVGEGSHSEIQKFLTIFFGTREQEWNLRVEPEQRVQISAGRFRIPDVCLIRGEAPFEEIVRVPPLLCIEILSRDDRMSEMYEKVEDYLTMGVAGVWMIDPRRRKVWQTDGGGVLQPKGEELALPGTPIRLRAADLFRQLDKLEGRER